MRVLFSSTAGQGHLQPLIPLIRAFEGHGHEVLTVAPLSLAETLNAEAINFRLSEEPPRAESDRLWSLFPTLARREASQLVERAWFAQLCLNAMLPAVQNAVDEWSPELVIRETCEYAAAAVADRMRIHHAQVGISTAATEASVLRELVKPEMENLSVGLTRRIFESPYLTKFPISLDPSPYPTTLRYRDDEGRDPHPLGDWWPGNKSPLVYLTFGTLATGTEDGQELLRKVLASIQGLDIRILVTTGSTMDPEDFDVPHNVRVESWVAQVDVFAEASVVICHGGSGTTIGALAAGVPLILLPLFADQPTNAALVQKAGAGIVVGDGGGSAELNSKNIEEQMTSVRSAIDQILTNSKYRAAAISLAKEIDGGNSLTNLVNRIAATV